MIVSGNIMQGTVKIDRCQVFNMNWSVLQLLLTPVSFRAALRDPNSDGRSAYIRYWVYN